MRHHALRPLRPLAVAGLALALALTGGLLAACGDDSEDSGATEDAAATVDPEGDANAADVMFVQMMIPHHEQAVVMADDALEISEDGTVRALAEDIRAAQQPEIDQMEGWLDEWGVPQMMDGLGDGMGSGEGMDHMGHGGMGGMMSEEDLEELREASGSEFDRMWTEMMIEHHEGAIDMARDVQDDGESPEVRELADAIVETQQAEIDLMEEWLSTNDG
ncbi:MAG: DUF305 domain-containing protein [Kineosporiaceae bacterium]